MEDFWKEIPKRIKGVILEGIQERFCKRVLKLISEVIAKKTWKKF